MLKIKIESEIYSCDVNIPDKKAYPFLRRINKSLRNRIKKINGCKHLHITGERFATNVAISKQFESLRLVSNEALTEIKKSYGYIASVQPVSKAIKVDIDRLWDDDDYLPATKTKKAV